MRLRLSNLTVAAINCRGFTPEYFGYLVGRVTVKVLPALGPGLAAAREAEWRSVMALQMARPGRRPAAWRGVLTSPCWKASKTLGRTCGGMPMPVSRTETWREGGVGLRERMKMEPPSGVNLMALRRRLEKTCWRRAG